MTHFNLSTSFIPDCLLHYWVSVCSVLWSGRLGYVRQWAEWRRAGEKEKNFTGTAGCTLMITRLLSFYCICTLLQTCIPLRAHLTVLVIPPWTDCEITPFSGIYGNVLHWAYTPTWLLIWYQETYQLINRCQVVFLLLLLALSIF